VIYSVYDYTRRSYDYYEGPGPSGTHAAAPPVARGRNALGASPEQVSWHLPPGAKKIGSGTMPRGRIATTALAGVDLGDTGSLLELGVIAYFAWRMLR
jgi:hypothetical protein